MIVPPCNLWPWRERRHRHYRDCWWLAIIMGVVIGVGLATIGDLWLSDVSFHSRKQYQAARQRSQSVMQQNQTNLFQQLQPIMIKQQRIVRWFFWLPQQFTAGMKLLHWQQDEQQLQWQFHNTLPVAMSELMTLLKQQPSIAKVSLSQAADSVLVTLWWR